MTEDIDSELSINIEFSKHKRINIILFILHSPVLCIVLIIPFCDLNKSAIFYNLLRNVNYNNDSDDKVSTRVWSGSYQYDDIDFTEVNNKFTSIENQYLNQA